MIKIDNDGGPNSYKINQTNNIKLSIKYTFFLLETTL